MRRIVSLILVAAAAFAIFAIGTASANGTFARLLGANSHAAAAPAVPATTVAPPAVVSTPANSRPGVPVSDVASATPTSPAANTTVSTSTNASGQPTPMATATTVPAPTATAAPTRVRVLLLPAPLTMSQAAGGNGALAAGSWTKGDGMTLRVGAPGLHRDAVAEVEIQPLSRAFSGHATADAPVSNGAATVIVPSLAQGTYHWQARFSSASAEGPWSEFAHGVLAFGIQATGPAAPHVSSPTDPNPSAAYATSTLTFNWTDPNDPAGTAGYAYRLDTNSHGAPKSVIRTTNQQLTLSRLDTGTYYFHVRARDNAGNWGQTATFPVHVDVTPPIVTSHAFSTSEGSGFTVDPSLENLQLSYTVSKASHVTVGVYDDAGDRVRHIVLPGFQAAGPPLNISWDGRDNAGKTVPAGPYSVYMRLTDHVGNAHVIGWSGLDVTYKHIEVSLSQQHLWAYDGATLFLDAPVTTGNGKLPTPTGTYHIIKSQTQFTFHSPWPHGSPYWYPDSLVNYALYFDPPGYFIHDAPWRTAYGPGTNNGPGLPSQGPDAGTHGCVNVPEDAMRQLYAWVPPGTVVHVIQ